jgi:hypothetical protein
MVDTHLPAPRKYDILKNIRRLAYKRHFHFFQAELGGIAPAQFPGNHSEDPFDTEKYGVPAPVKK